MPRIMRQVHEYFDNRIIRGLEFSFIEDTVTPGKRALNINVGAGVINKVSVALAAAKVLRASDFIVITDGVPNKLLRFDIVVLTSAGAISVVHGVPGAVGAPVAPALSLLLAQVTIRDGWNNFVGEGPSDEVAVLRSEYVIDTRFLP